MPHANAILDCSPIAAAGHCVPQMYQPISASQFMDDLCAEERAVSNHSEAPSVSINPVPRQFNSMHGIHPYSAIVMHERSTPQLSKSGKVTC